MSAPLKHSSAQSQSQSTFQQQSKPKKLTSILDWFKPLQPGQQQSFQQKSFGFPTTVNKSVSSNLGSVMSVLKPNTLQQQQQQQVQIQAKGPLKQLDIASLDHHLNRLPAVTDAMILNKGAIGQQWCGQPAVRGRPPLNKSLQGGQKVQKVFQVESPRLIVDIPELPVIPVEADAVNVFLDLVNVFEFVRSLSKTQKLDCEELEFDEFMELLTEDPMWFLDLLKELLYEVISDDLPQLKITNVTSLFALYLQDELPELTLAFLQKDYSDLTLEELGRAMRALIDHFCSIDLYRDHISKLFKDMAEYQAAKHQKSRRLAETQSEKINCLRQLEKVQVDLEREESGLEEFVGELEKRMEEQFPIDRVQMDKQALAEVKRQRRNYRKEFEEELEKCQASVNSLKSFKSELETKIKQLRSEITDLEVTIRDEINAETVNREIRGGRLRKLGCDRYMRTFWQVPYLGVILVEPPVKWEMVTEEEQGESTEIDSSAETNEIDDALKFIGDKRWRYIDSVELCHKFKASLRVAKEPELVRNVDRYLHALSFTPKLEEGGWLDWLKMDRLNLEEKERAAKNYSSLLSRVAKQSIKSLHQSLYHIYGYTKMGVQHNCIDLQAVLDSGMQSSVDMSAMEQVTTEEFKNRLSSALLFFSPGFFNHDYECLFCRLAFNYSDTSDCCSRETWDQWLDQKSMSALYLYYEHLQQHMEPIMEQLKKVGGKFVDPAKQATGKSRQQQQQRQSKRSAAVSDDDSEEDNNTRRSARNKNTKNRSLRSRR